MHVGTGGSAGGVTAADILLVWSATSWSTSPTTVPEVNKSCTSPASNERKCQAGNYELEC